MFLQTIMTVFSAIFQLALISITAAVLMRKKIVTKEQIHALSNVTVNIFLPCLIIAKTLIRFQPEKYTNWWILPIAGAILVLTGMLLSSILFLFRPEKKPLMALSGLQNGIYITLPIGQILLPDEFDLYALYCFLLVIGLNTLMWSIGKVMISGSKRSEIKLKDFITPPLLSIILSVALVLTKISLIIPEPVITAMDLLGQATIPLAVFVLGATMGAISLKKMPKLYDIFVVSMVKFVLIPATAFSLLYYGGYYEIMPMICLVIIIQSTSPPATNLILIVENYGGDTQAISSMMFIQYILCIIAMPLWIAAWQYFV